MTVLETGDRKSERITHRFGRVVSHVKTAQGGGEKAKFSFQWMSMIAGGFVRQPKSTPFVLGETSVVFYERGLSGRNFADAGGGVHFNRCKRPPLSDFIPDD